MSLTRSNFKKRNACVRSKDDIVTKTDQNRWFDETVTARQMFEAFIKGEYDPGCVDDIYEDVKYSYSETNIDDVTEVQEAMVKKLSETMWRIINSWFDIQYSFVPDEPIYLDLSDKIDKWQNTHFKDEDDIKVQFNCIIDKLDPNVTNGKAGSVEGIILIKGMPKLSKTTRGEQNVFNDVFLHLMRLALRKYADAHINPGCSCKIIASYYYLSKTSDKSTTSIVIDDYFKDDNAIRCLSEEYTHMPEGTTAPDTEYDKMLKDILEKYAIGYDKCDLKEEKDCVGCQRYFSCYYKAPPIVDPESISTGIKARGKIPPDEYQEVVENFRSGIAVVDAPPGSGKTEVTTERTVMMALEILDEYVKRYESGEDIDIPITADFVTKDSRE